MGAAMDKSIKSCRALHQHVAPSTTNSAPNHTTLRPASITLVRHVPALVAIVALQPVVNGIPLK